MPINPDDFGPKTERYGPKSERMLRADDTEYGMISDIYGAPDDVEADDDGTMIAQLKRLRPPDFILFSRLPNYGVTRYRNVVVETGSAAVELASSGEIRVSSGTTTGSTASVETRERGQYRSGAEAEAGIGVRIPTSSVPTGSAVIRFGYFDQDNGFGFGYDADGWYLFRRLNGSDTIRRRADWNTDTLDGSGDASNPSGLSFDPAQGDIYNIRYWWYGYGAVVWVIEVPTADASRRRRVTVHSEIFTGGLSITDPNQPIRVDVDNGDTTDDLEIFVGGRQYGIRANTIAQDRRPTSAFVLDTDIPSGGGFLPLICVRLKPEFPAGSGRTNSVRAVIDRYSALTDDLTGFRISELDTITTPSAAGWVNAQGRSDAETAVEFQLQDGNLAITRGESVSFSAVDASTTGGSAAVSFGQSEAVLLGQGNIVTLSAATIGANTPNVAFANLRLDEQF